MTPHVYKRECNRVLETRPIITQASTAVWADTGATETTGAMELVTVEAMVPDTAVMGAMGAWAGGTVATEWEE